MGLILDTKRCEFDRVKHTFNADDGAEILISAADKRLNDKTEFINRCIREVGRRVMDIILAERNEATARILMDLPARDKSTKGKPSSKQPKKACRIILFPTDALSDCEGSPSPNR